MKMPSYENEAVSDTERGLYGKYRVERIDGKEKGPYFVLAYRTDPHAQAALAEYADSCRDDYPALAADLIAELSKYSPWECDQIPQTGWVDLSG